MKSQRAPKRQPTSKESICVQCSSGCSCAALLAETNLAASTTGQSNMYVMLCAVYDRIYGGDKSMQLAANIGNIPVWPTSRRGAFDPGNCSLKDWPKAVTHAGETRDTLASEHSLPDIPLAAHGVISVCPHYGCVVTMILQQTSCHSTLSQCCVVQNRNLRGCLVHSRL